MVAGAAGAAGLALLAGGTLSALSAVVGLLAAGGGDVAGAETEAGAVAPAGVAAGGAAGAAGVAGVAVGAGAIRSMGSGNWRGFSSVAIWNRSVFGCDPRVVCARCVVFCSSGDCSSNSIIFEAAAASPISWTSRTLRLALLPPGGDFISKLCSHVVSGDRRVSSSMMSMAANAWYFLVVAS